MYRARHRVPSTASTEGPHTKYDLLDASLRLPMEFTKKGASAFAKLHEQKRAQVRETRRLLEERSRQIMERSALLKHDIDAFRSELATVGIHDYLTGVAYVCACAPLYPAVWSTLPEELLQRVLSRLPLLDIICLRVLSKTWDRFVTGGTPRFTKLCAERNPNLFALVSKGSRHDSDNGPMVVKLYNIKGKKWHRFLHETYSVGETCGTMLAGNGGLVCRVSTPPDKEMELVVFNPLTRQGRELPLCSSLSRIHPRMVQLVMDRDSKCYKVLGVGTEEQGGGDAVARIFSSLTGKWSTPQIFSDLIFGCHYRWKIDGGHGMMTVKKVGPCAYDCATSTLLELHDGCPGNTWDISVLVNGRLFELFSYCKENNALYEYQAQSCQTHWVPLKVHECFELDEISGYLGSEALETQFFGCQDFLLVIAYYERFDGDEQTPTRTLLFDLFTSEWQIICSGIPEWSADFASDMFELRWDVVP